MLLINRHQARMIRVLLSGVWMCLLVSAAFSQGAGARQLSMQDAINLALQHNTDVKNAALSHLQTKARAWEIITMGLPQINGSIEYSYYFREPVQPAINRAFSSGPSVEAWQHLTVKELMAGDSSLYKIFSGGSKSDPNDNPFILSHNATIGFSVSQLIVDGRYFVGLQARKKLLETSAYSKQMTERDIKNEVRKAYLNALVALESKKVLEENEAIIERLLDGTRIVYREGFAEELDVDKLELNLTRLRNQLHKTQLQSENALAYLKFKIGLDFSEQIELTDNLQRLRSQMPERTRNTFQPSDRVEYRMLQNNATLQGYDKAQKRAQNFPALFGFLSYGYNAQTDDFSELFRSKTFDGFNMWNPTGIVGLKLSVPIWDFGGRMMQVRQAKLEQQKAQNNLRNFEQAAALQLQVAQNNFNNALMDEVTSRKALELSEKIFNKSSTMFKEGVGSSFNLTIAESDFTTAKINYTLAIYNLLSSRVELDHALGEQ